MEDRSGMKPEMGDTSIVLPITFDYSGGRQDRSKSKRMWAIILSVIMVIVIMGTFFGKNPWYIKIPMGVGEALLFTLFLRFIMFKEGKKKELYKDIIATDGEMPYTDIWGIYSIEEEYPFVCHFRNGKNGLYIRLNKDVILGKYEESEYNHYEAVADAYNLAGSGHIQMMHIDYMASVGTDERLEESFKSLVDVPNPDLKNILTDIYSYQQVSMKHRVTTYDVYAFLWTGNDTTAWNQIVRILNCFLEANYRSYRVLNQREIRELVKEVFNLEDFSIVEASAQAFETGESVTVSRTIVPISITDANGVVTKINPTMAEKAAERKAREEEALAKEKELARRKQEGKKGKKNSDSPDDDEVFDDVF